MINNFRILILGRGLWSGAVIGGRLGRAQAPAAAAARSALPIRDFRR